MHGVPRAPRTTLLAVILTAVLAVGACGSDQTDSASPAPPAASQPAAKSSKTAAPAPAPSPSSSAAATPSAQPRQHGHKVGSLAPSPRPKPESQVAEHLLSADDLPPLAGEWTARNTADEPTVGACQKTGLSTIGAIESAQRTFVADGATAVQVVARFGDAKSAWRAHEVLAAWRADCAERLGNPSSSVGPLEDVWVPTGTGSSYRSAYRKRTAGLGILRTGEYLTLVEISADPRSYPAGWEPARVAVRRVARTF